MVIPRFHFVALACVAAIACGQVLFKMVAVASREHQSLLHPEVAVAIYFAATLGWIWVLQFAPLSRVYPYFAASFALVPIASYLFFGEPLSVQYFVGVAFIVGGVVMTLIS